MIKIRPAIITDFNEIFDLLVILYDSNQLNKTTILKLFELELKNIQTIQLVAILDNSIVGFVSATQRIDYQEQDNISQLTNLVVNENSRGEGVGNQLLNSIETACKEIGSKELHFSSTFKREKSHKFYESKGYQKTAYYFWKVL